METNPETPNETTDANGQPSPPPLNEGEQYPDLTDDNNEADDAGHEVEQQG